MSVSSISITDVPPTFRETRSVRRNTLFPDALLRQFVASRSGIFSSSDAETLQAMTQSNANSLSTSESSRRHKSGSTSSSNRKSKAANVAKKSNDPKRISIDTNQNKVHKIDRRKTTSSSFDVNPPVVIPDTRPTSSAAPRSRPSNDTSKRKAQRPRSTSKDKGSPQKTGSCDPKKPCKVSPAADVHERVNINLNSITSDNDVRVSINACGCRQNAPPAEEGSVESSEDPVQALRNEITAFRQTPPCCNTAPIRVDITPRRTEIPVVLKDGPNPLERTGSDYLNQLREEIFKYRKMATDHESELEQIRQELKGFRSCPCTSLSDVNEGSTPSSSTSEQESSTKSTSSVDEGNTDENDYQDARENASDSDDAREREDSVRERPDLPPVTQSVTLEVELRLENLLDDPSDEGSVPGIQTVPEVKATNEAKGDSRDNQNGEDSFENREASDDQDLDTSNQDVLGTNDAEAEHDGEAEDDASAADDDQDEDAESVDSLTELDPEPTNPKDDDEQPKENICG